MAPATSTNGGRLQSHLLHQCRVWLAVSDEAMLLLLGSDEVAHLEIDMGGEAGLIVAQRREFFLQRDPVVARQLGGLRRPRRLDRPAPPPHGREVADGGGGNVGGVVML